MTDIVDNFLFRLATHIPDLPMDTRLSIERDIRGHYGGTRAGDIAKGVDGLSKTTRTYIVGMGLRHQKPIREIFEMASVSRSTGYRILRSK